ncbi:hypothetical protein [Actinokineospora sp. HUAS TT18]|uniref:hypothetical protein n=1 Tax=Actinokineospora sp. HUAS TT18 TaxID=3447451 RepID=UPI003F51D2BA
MTHTERILRRGERPDVLDPEHARRALRETFMGAQGRQYIQIPLIDVIARTWLEQDIHVNMSILDSQQAREAMAQTALPRGHVRVGPAARIRGQYLFWWQLMLHIIDYIYLGDANQLPTREDIDTLVAHVGGTSYMPGFNEEELAAIQVMLDRYRDADPSATLTSDQVLDRFVLPALVQGDRHWVSNPDHHRPGTILRGAHESMLRVALIDCRRKLTQDRELTDLECVYARLDTLLQEGCLDTLPTFNCLDTLPTFKQLVAEYNAQHAALPFAWPHGPDEPGDRP